MSRDVLLAAVIGAQGLKGAVKAKIFTADPQALPRYRRLHDRSGKTYEITAFRPGRPGEAVMSFQGIASRSAAEALKGVELFVDRAALPQAGEEEFYHADLIGLEAQDGEGRVLGMVTAIHNFGAGDVIEIALHTAGQAAGAPDDDNNGDTLLLAFTRQTVPVIDLAQRRIEVAVPKDDAEGNHVE